MSTNSITQPMHIKASQLKELNDKTQLSSTMVEIMVKNRDVYKNIGNRDIIKSLKI
ncbi:hypothetical protein AB4027_06000 [Alkalibacterium putridalgicola]|uniref:hypothetical protein n=1 Tax=Alkalibacterium putridalgicola TaxID=426703 RepID=UPI0034CD38D8